MLWQRPGLATGRDRAYLVLALLLFLPERSESMRLVTAAGLCASALLAYAMNRQLLHGMLLLLCLGLSLFAAMFMSGKGQAALTIGDAMPMMFCLAALALRCATGLYGDCGWRESLLPRLRAAWLIGCAGLLSLLYVQQLPAALVGAALYAWSCAGLLFLPPISMEDDLAGGAGAVPRQRRAGRPRPGHPRHADDASQRRTGPGRAVSDLALYVSDVRQVLFQIPAVIISPTNSTATTQHRNKRHVHTNQFI